MDRDNRWERVSWLIVLWYTATAETKTMTGCGAAEELRAGSHGRVCEAHCGDQRTGLRRSSRIDSRRGCDDFFNFRADRARQMTYALAPGIRQFADEQSENLFFVG